MKVRDITAAMERIAPPALAEGWDNVGLLAGDPDAECAPRVVLCIDLGAGVAADAVARGAGCVIAYHPPIFAPIKRLVADTPSRRALLDLLRAGIAVHSPHTALDGAEGGMTDWLADAVLEPSVIRTAGNKGGGGADRRALSPHPVARESEELKIVTFVPSDRVDAVRQGLATAGAGRIGAYDLCSFAHPGTGTFRGNETSNPAVGTPGMFERVDETRIEMVCSRAGLALALETLRTFHPYEEPAIDVYALEPRPLRSAGSGRRLTLDHPARPSELAARVKRFLGVDSVALATVSDRPVSRVGVCPGAGGALVAAARREGCELFLTGEMKHHEIRAALDTGVSLILGGHTNTERPYLPRLAARLHDLLPGAEVVVSDADSEPTRRV
ncbi:MAG: Nif3-like dinuclear metal center hexameric protein [Phycisphaerae bacterium]|nr:Nif3-like dinuclear metal center hexameric protein [Phycisphaerae bacterium]